MGQDGFQHRYIPLRELVLVAGAGAALAGGGASLGGTFLGGTSLGGCALLAAVSVSTNADVDEMSLTSPSATSTTLEDTVV